MTGERILVEILDSHGRVQMHERITLDGNKRTFTIGRSVDADVTLYDVHAAAMHASLEVTPAGTIQVTDLGSLNGIVTGGKRYRSAQNIDVADSLLQVGRTRLRIRSARETLAPEQADHLRPASIVRDPAWIAGIAAGAGAAQLAYTNWLGAPQDFASTFVTALLSAILGTGAWVAFWALLSRMLQGEWRWLRHAAIILGITTVFFAINAVLDLGWFALSLPQWNTRAAWVGAIALGCALYLHLTNASSITTRRAAMVACIVPALSGGAGQWLQERQQQRDVNHIGTSLRIYPPSLRLRSADSLDDYFQNTKALREAADKKRKSTHADEDGSESSDDDN